MKVLPSAHPYIKNLPPLDKKTIIWDKYTEPMEYSDNFKKFINKWYSIFLIKLGLIIKKVSIYCIKYCSLSLDKNETFEILIRELLAHEFIVFYLDIQNNQQLITHVIELIEFG